MPAGGSVALPLAVTDPLPIVRARVNGGDEVDCVIDTGAPETQIDEALAKRLGIQDFGSTSGMFAGGRRSPVHHGRVDSLQVAGLTVRNVPVGIMNFSGLGRAVFGGRKIGGIIGTVLFYHFRTTLDYAGHQLILRDRTAAGSDNDTGSKAVPFWMAGDHFIVAWGKVNDAPPVLLFVDTGLAGGGFTAGKSLIDEAHITLDEKHASHGLGGGGMVRVVPFTVKDLSLGEVRAHNIRGVFDGVLPMEHSLGFRIGGIISHEFFKPYALTFDFDHMRLLIGDTHAKK
jgi:predicted aspartyl protease